MFSDDPVPFNYKEWSKQFDSGLKETELRARAAQIEKLDRLKKWNEPKKSKAEMEADKRAAKWAAMSQTEKDATRLIPNDPPRRDPNAWRHSEALRQNKLDGNLDQSEINTLEKIANKENR